MISAKAQLPICGFDYVDGALCCEGVALENIATEVGTPTFVYSARALENAFRAVDEALDFAPHVVAYAVKANGNLAVLSHLARLGSGADVVSVGELERALKVGIAPEKIVFSGVGKRRDELHRALMAGIRSIHVESAAELDVVEEVSKSLGKVAPVALRINPDVDPKTHPYISTGLHTTKFGLELDVARGLLARIAASKSIRLDGIAMHIGSQLSSPLPLGEAVAAVASFAMECRASGFPVRDMDVGGGWPASYGDEKTPVPPLSEFAEAIRTAIARAGAANRGFQLIVEPGRAIAADAGVLLTRVLYEKRQGQKRFLIVDAAITELIRPALYKAFHGMIPVREPTSSATWEVSDVVGPVCETADFLALDRPMPPMSDNDLLAIRGAGAYAAGMSSQYNARPRAAEVLVRGSDFRVVRKRDTLEDLWRNETTWDSTRNL